LDDYRANVESMISQAQEAGIKVVILSATVIYENLNGPENAKAGPYNACLRELAAKHSCLFIDFQRPFRTLIRDYQRSTGGHDDLLTVDGVHMNASGNRVMAHTILTGLGISAKDQETVQPQVMREMGRR
jgi:lysophospholipase L1-like esterase